MSSIETSARDKALTSLVAYLALDKTADLPCVISEAREQGIPQDQIDRISIYVNDLRSGKKAAEPSLSELLAGATRSSCCS